MDRATKHIVRLRAGGLCEYCRLPESLSGVTFPLDHIIAQQHGGQTISENLALACPECNRQKGPNLASLDPPGTGEMVILFRPRTDVWSDHFEWDGAVLRGKTAKGRATAFLLDINNPLRVVLRESLMDEGLFPRDPKDSK